MTGTDNICSCIMTNLEEVESVVFFFLTIGRICCVIMSVSALHVTFSWQSQRKNGDGEYERVIYTAVKSPSSDTSN